MLKTNYFPSFADAVDYHKKIGVGIGNVRQKIRAREIKIGSPPGDLEDYCLVEEVISSRQGYGLRWYKKSSLEA
tara:strand:- start:93 stop:314 length:222 start_codon:yes stop_codon:yes gene_type:complete